MLLDGEKRVDDLCLMVTNVVRDLQRKEKMFTPQGTTRKREREELSCCCRLSVDDSFIQGWKEESETGKPGDAVLRARTEREKPESGFLPIVVFVFVSVSSG